MQNLRVTLVQANQAWEDKQANLENYTRLLSGVQSDLIVLPEMFHTAFTMNTAGLGESMNGDGIRWLKQTSAEKNAAIYTSLIIEDGEHHYNRGVLVFPNGDIATYDKRKSFGLAGEDNYFTSGNTETIVEYKGWKLALQICYDLRFPEISRNRISNQSPAYDVLLYVANWPAKRSAHWNTLLQARAIENQCFVVGVNRVGNDANGLDYSGHSQVVDALGKVQYLPEKEEAVETIVLSTEHLLEIRERLPFLKDR